MYTVQKINLIWFEKKWISSGIEVELLSRNRTTHVQHFVALTSHVRQHDVRTEPNKKAEIRPYSVRSVKRKVGRVGQCNAKSMCGLQLWKILIDDHSLGKNSDRVEHDPSTVTKPGDGSNANVQHRKSIERISNQLARRPNEQQNANREGAVNPAGAGHDEAEQDEQLEADLNGGKENVSWYQSDPNMHNLQTGKNHQKWVQRSDGLDQIGPVRGSCVEQAEHDRRIGKQIAEPNTNIVDKKINIFGS